MKSSAANAGWLDILFDPRDAGEVWTEIFRRLGELAAQLRTRQRCIKRP